MLAQTAGRSGKLSSGHALVQPPEYFGMDSFEAHGDFEAAGQKFAEAEAVFANQRGMAFDDNALEAGNAVRDCRVILNGDGARVEEAAAVIEFDLPRRREALQSVVNLCRNRSRWHRLRQRVLPEIAHQASPGALAVGEKDGGDGNRAQGTGSALGAAGLVFDEKA